MEVVFHYLHSRLCRKEQGCLKNFGLDYGYDFKRNSHLSVGVRYYQRKVSGENTDQIFGYYSGQETLESGFNTAVLSRLNTPDIHLDYLKKFRSGSKLEFSAYFSQTRYERNKGFRSEDTGTGATNETNKFQINNREFILQSDFSVPVKQNQLFGIGLKASARSNSWRDSFIIMNPSNGRITSGYNVFGYSRDLLAAYVNYRMHVGGFSAELGVRYELMQNAALQGGIRNAGYWDFTVLNPSARLARKLSEKLDLTFNYWRRAQYPEENQFAFVSSVTGRAVSHELNLDAKPEVSDNLELGLNQSFTKGYQSLAVFARFTGNLLIMNASIEDLFSGRNKVWYNDGRQSDLGISYHFSYRVFPGLLIAGGTDLGNTSIKGRRIREDAASELNNKKWYLGGRLLLQYQVPGQWQFQANLNRSGQQVDFISRLEPLTSYATGLSKKFNREKSSLGIVAEQFFHKQSGVNLHSRTATYNYTLKTTLVQDRALRISFSHRF